MRCRSLVSRCCRLFTGRSAPRRVARPIAVLSTALAIAPALAATSIAAHASTPESSSAPKLSLEQIMANPDWIGPAVESPYWSLDGTRIFYQLKRAGSPVRDTWSVGLDGGSPRRLTASGIADIPGGQALVFDAAHDSAAFIRHDALFVVSPLGAAPRQISVASPSAGSDDHGEEGESGGGNAPDGLMFSPDGHVLNYRQGTQWYRYHLASGLTQRAAVLKTERDPDKPSDDDLARLQHKLFSTLRQNAADDKSEHRRAAALSAADPGRSPQPFYLGEKIAIDATSLSPDGRWMLVVTHKADYDEGEKSRLLHEVTDSGYEEYERARTRVGRNTPAPQSLLLLDLRHHRQYALSTDHLPGIHKDPLAKIRAATVARLKAHGRDAAARALKAPKIRSLRVNEDAPGGGIAWSDDARQVALELRSIDNKDRWIATLNLATHRLVPANRLHDKAWINWSFNDFGWLKHGHTLWFLSEASGHSQLYTKSIGQSPGPSAQALTHGDFEVSSPTLSHDGRFFYVKINRWVPWAYDIYRLPVHGGALQRVTHLKAIDDFIVGPNDKHLAVLYSDAYLPPQLASVDLTALSDPGTAGKQTQNATRKITDTRGDAFKAIDWNAPKFVKIASSHGAFGIWAKLYLPRHMGSGPHPGVLFVHGAGYLQDVDKGYSYYFREQMFANLLNREGYVVLDMDYRGSAGYGRDWRTTIYRNMGHPELQDLKDGKAWLVAHEQVDANRVGIYGGSYGGFMTEMALLRAPGVFAAGAALRPVSDWTQYNDGYSSDILNTPQLDPKAYARSSPIRYAKNLADPLLMEHGLIDNNVLPEDTLRLYQRFIELHKSNFWISLYPMERHAFEHADSWYDEYRRIHDLFTRFVKTPAHTSPNASAPPAGRATH